MHIFKKASTNDFTFSCRYELITTKQDKCNIASLKHKESCFLKTLGKNSQAKQPARSTRYFIKAPTLYCIVLSQCHTWVETTLTLLIEYAQSLNSMYPHSPTKTFKLVYKGIYSLTSHAQVKIFITTFY